jgi:hypothetical protein
MSFYCFGLLQGPIRGSVGVVGCGGLASELDVSGWGSSGIFFPPSDLWLLEFRVLP